MSAIKRTSLHLLFYAVMAAIILLLTHFKWAPGHATALDESFLMLEERVGGTLSILTYNIAGLPDFISAASGPRAQHIAQIGRRVNSFDLVHVQEDFYFNQDLYQRGNTHPYRSTTAGGAPFGDGLSTLSHYPIVQFQRIPWTHCYGADCFTRKGFTQAIMLVAQDVQIAIYNVHATASMHPLAVEARQHNLAQLARYIEQHSDGQALLVMGDFNAYYSCMEDQLPAFLNQTGLADCWAAIEHHSAIPTPNPHFRSPHKLSIGQQQESLDKILFRSSPSLKISPYSYSVERDLFTLNNSQPLSDHLAVSVGLAWQRQQDLP